MGYDYIVFYSLNFVFVINPNIMMSEKKVLEAILRGELKSKLKRSNLSWLALLTLTFLMWIGTSIKHRSINDELREENKNLRYKEKLDSIAIWTLKTANDSAVYFKDLLKLENKIKPKKRKKNEVPN